MRKLCTDSTTTRGWTRRQLMSAGVLNLAGLLLLPPGFAAAGLRADNPSHFKLAPFRQQKV